MRIRLKLLVLSLAGLAGLTATPAIASASPRLVAVAGAQAVPAGSVRLGVVPPATSLRLDVVLALPHPGAVDAFLAAVSDRRSPLFGRFLRPGQFGPRFGPALATVTAVRAALRQAGLRPGPTAADRLSLPVTASAAAIEHAFGVSLDRYRLPGGRIAYTTATAPKLPEAVSGDVVTILGLASITVPRHLLGAPPRPLPAKPTSGGATLPDGSGPQPCASVPSGAAGHTINDFAARYGMSPMYGLGDFGRRTSSTSRT